MFKKLVILRAVRSSKWPIVGERSIMGHLNFKVVLLNFPIETNEIELSIEHSPRPHNSTQALYRDILSLSCYLSAVNERKGYVPQF